MSSVPLMHATWGAWPWLAPLWILLWIVVVATVIRIVTGRRGFWCGPYASRRGHGADQILAERFARGEIDAAEYQSRRDALRQ